MTLIRRGSAKRKYDQRRAWLSARPALYDAVPGINDDVTVAGRVHLDALLEQMQALGLVGGTHPQEVSRETVRRLVSELRGEHVGGGW